MTSGSEVFGVWRLVSAKVKVEDTGEEIDVHGENPRGFAIFEPSGRMMAIITPSGRIAPKNDAEAAALFKGMTAYTGRIRVEGNTIVTAVDAAWHPDWEKTEQMRFVDLSGDTLTLSTPVRDHPSLPKPHRGIFTWTREQELPDRATA
jgi:hypothetical protein